MLQDDELKEMVHENAKAISEIVAKEEGSQNKFYSVEFRQKQIQEQIVNHVEIVQKKMYEGLKSCILSLDECSDLPMDINELMQELQTCLSSVDSIEKLSKLGDSFLSQISWKSQLRISDKCMDTLFRGATHLFDKKDYESAEKAFFALCCFDSTQFAYWVGLAHSYFHEAKYEEAINAYGTASALDPEDSWPHIWAANAFEEEKDFDRARMAIDRALELEKAKTAKNLELIQSLEERVQRVKMH
ncbi:MAG: tetratricopeptide repeat protein [Verrucomicrobia bacterium]|nr:tetratricopeptide repeat protein [Verrucomicrobiota bacterium]